MVKQNCPDVASEERRVGMARQTPIRPHMLAAFALIGSFALAACSGGSPAGDERAEDTVAADEPAATAGETAPPMAEAETPAAADAAPQGRCTLDLVTSEEATKGLPLTGAVGDLRFYANGADLMCSEPTGLEGDCQIADGKTVGVTRGSRGYRITSNEPNTYLSYGPGRIECVAPPGAAG